MSAPDCIGSAGRSYARVRAVRFAECPWRGRISSRRMLEQTMIEQFQARNFKALREVTLELSPIHVLIGPNDSGKTSVLEAIGALSRSVDLELATAFRGPWTGLQLLWRGQPGKAVSLSAKVADQHGQFEYGFSAQFQPESRAVRCHDEWFRVGSDTETGTFNRPGHSRTMVCGIRMQGHDATAEQKNIAGRIYEGLHGVHECRWNPPLLALPVAPDSQRRYRMEPSGFGLALCLDEILGFDRRRFDELEDRFRSIFPQFKAIRLVQEMAFRAPPDSSKPVPILSQADGKGIHFELVDGLTLAAAQVSDGTLLVLAYLTLLHLPEPPRLVLVEEPENGIHPKGLQNVLQILRDLVKEQSQTQVVMTTHSPYVVDLFAPEEVTLCKRQGDGSVSVKRLSESATVREQLDVFTLGEIWSAEGDEALIEPRHEVQGTAG
ncbi:MAG: AAA family ATPase [Planctomycetaceae bacterium]